MEESDKSMPSKDKEEILTSLNEPVLEGASSAPSKAHYDVVKMKYFSSLGMNKPPNDIMKRDRSTTAPPINQELTTTADKRYIIKTTSPARKRSVSTPPNSKGIPIPPGRSESMAHSTMFQFDSDEEEFNQVGKQYDDNASYRPGGEFIPPHEMLAKGSFEVGTAKSVAVWESQRRKKMTDLTE